MDVSVPIFQQVLSSLGRDVVPAGECGFEGLAAEYRARLQLGKGPVHIKNMTALAECPAALMEAYRIDCGALWVS